MTMSLRPERAFGARECGRESASFGKRPRSQNAAGAAATESESESESETATETASESAFRAPARAHALARALALARSRIRQISRPIVERRVRHRQAHAAQLLRARSHGGALEQVQRNLHDRTMLELSEESPSNPAIERAHRGATP